MFNKDLITIGADPELFLKTKDNKVFPAFLIVDGTKQEPLAISNDGHAIQYDNVMLEYNIPPCRNVEEFVKNNKFVLDYVRETIAEPNELTLDICASTNIEEEYLVHPIANEFGCSPDYNAYTEKQNIFVKAEDATLRSAGGHLHISYPGLDDIKAIKLIKALDLLISIPLVLCEPDSQRKKLYGKAGAFRMKELENGTIIVEYRSPSNFWLISEDTMKFAYNKIIEAVEFVETEQIITNEDDIVKAINQNDKDLAKEIIEDYHLELPFEVVSAPELTYNNDSLGG